MRISDWSSDVCSSDLLHCIAALRHHLQIEVAGVARRRADGVVDVEYIRRAFAREAAQPTQCDLDVARAEFDGIVEIAEVALLPDLDGLFLSAGSADAHASRVVAAMTDRTGAASADPLVSAFVALFLFLLMLPPGFHLLVEAAEG